MSWSSKLAVIVARRGNLWCDDKGDCWRSQPPTVWSRLWPWHVVLLVLLVALAACDGGKPAPDCGAPVDAPPDAACGAPLVTCESLGCGPTTVLDPSCYATLSCCVCVVVVAAPTPCKPEPPAIAGSTRPGVP